MTKRIIITPYAREQIRTTALYINTKLNNNTAAVKWVKGINQAVEELVDFPNAYPLIDKEPWKSEGIRIRVVDSFNVYYLVEESKETIYILAVIYGKRDQLKQLKEMQNNIK